MARRKADGARGTWAIPKRCRRWHFFLGGIYMTARRIRCLCGRHCRAGWRFAQSDSLVERDQFPVNGAVSCIGLFQELARSGRKGGREVSNCACGEPDCADCNRDLIDKDAIITALRSEVAALRKVEEAARKMRDLVKNGIENANDPEAFLQVAVKGRLPGRISWGAMVEGIDDSLSALDALRGKGGE